MASFPRCVIQQTGLLAVYCALVIQTTAAPNVLLILVDDLGYSDLGCYGGEIATPNLDRLAANGLRFTQFYNTGRCWPTRGSLLTGYYAQQIRRDKLPGVESGAGGKRPVWAQLLPNFLESAGYRSYHSGKWHIDGMPLENGFDRSYYLRDQGRFFNPKIHWLDDVKQAEVSPDSGYYATTAIADHAVEVLQEHASQFPEQPFFHYLAFTAPHFPLHALPEDIARYQTTYQRDWAMVRRERWERQQRLGLGLGELSPVEVSLGPPYHFPDHLEILGEGETNRPVLWSTLTAVQRSFQASKMAIHAAMVDRIDREIGRVLDQIRSMGQWGNTLILFLSDNGASAEIMVRTDGHDSSVPMGSAASYLCLGPGWSTVSNTPFRRHKTWTHEGGISTPLVMHWPQGIKGRGEVRKTPGHVIDIVPTLLELAGVERPPIIEGKAAPSAPGKSLVPLFTENADIKRDYLWWYHDEHRAIRQGDWKLVAPKDQAWELYHVGEDRAESRDLSALYAKRRADLAALWQDLMESFRELALSDGQGRLD